MHGDDLPGLKTDALTNERSALFEVAFSAVEDLVSGGVDQLQVDRLLAELADAYHIQAA